MVALACCPCFRTWVPPQSIRKRYREISHRPPPLDLSGWERRRSWESMAEDVARPIPGTRSAIEGLKKVTFEFEDGLRSIGECIICAEEFEGGLELTRLPCAHVYHGDCIVKWLETSHRCPLCRYPLPYVRLLIDAYMKKSPYKDVESAYLELIKSWCIPTEDTYALLLKAYCTSALLEKAVFAEMLKFGLPPS
ncbi:hypothetical protein FH972_002018 [Carpinus fangiana]|uniref:RING-type E3 ubiquitin transferase n=1 Tax=Carpinus fangiana TaxID=176857 RepID=A0A5N6QDW7_9ROSI|nr:hypothetical protein FH972_002018 [Carpinus fangiana]